MASTNDGLYRSSCSISSLADAPLAKAKALPEQSLALTPTPPPAIPAAATVTAATLPSIPLDRYLAKLEECAELHRQLEELAHTKEAVEQRLASCQAEAVQLRQTVHRLECVLQLRNEELVLLHDYRRQRGGGGGDGAPASMRVILPAAEPVAQALDRAHGGADRQFTHAAEGAAAADQGVILEYIRTSCYVGCPTHPQLIQSFFAASSGEALVATEPPLTYAQGSVLHRLLTQTPITWGAAATPAVAELSAFRTWACEHLRTFSVRFEDAYAGVSILSDALLHSLPSLAQLEVWGVGSDAALTKLTDALVGATQVRELSLPELVVDDEGLQALWRLLQIRGSMHAPCTAAVPAETSSIDSLALELCTLDLSACHIKDPLTLAHLHCPSVAVLLLPPTDCMTDSLLAKLLQRCPRLHTLDLSGCARLTDACVEFFNSAAPQLRVLALEHCPHVHRLQLDHVEVLLSSLAHVHALMSRSLRVLPLPVQQRAVLASLVAPRLSQISLHGLPVDEEVLRRLNGRSGEVDGCGEGVRLTSVTFSECTFVSDDVFAGFLRSQTDLQKLSLVHCKGLSNACWMAKRGLPIFAALHTLELVNLRTLTDEALRELTQACPTLQQLNLHGAGWSHLTDISIRQLDQLSELRVLNLLALNPDLVTAPVVTALVQRLPQLQRLYHETAITLAGHSESVESGDKGALHPVSAVDITSASVSSSVIVERNDAEARWRAALRDYPLRMLRLQHHSALVLWTDRVRTAGSCASREDVAQATSESLLTATTVNGGDDGSGIQVAEAAAVGPSKLFPAMAARTMAAAIAASAASTLTLPSLKVPAPPHEVAPGEVRLGVAEGVPHASRCLGASPHHEATLLPPMGRSTPEEPAHMDADECDEASPVHEQHQLNSPLSYSSSGSSTYTQPSTQEGSHESAGHISKRSLVQCANAAASAAFQSYQHRPVRMSPGSSRPSATTAAPAPHACSVEDVAEAFMGPWEE
ncbi:putative leucine-rich repeat protein [Leishmania mexicana MHOM/GT/2001/U1103]|uniref:Leucine-rich repeat protein n=1 Tax=Leishmania mexicana (strain MHOM/GT/2001/U1103) TaxID=929439 RepID=E9AMQ4_LEIMU|nr:putative leucine-rich repeat protein [Leishmania mexicana MHOM/GT/2001/U1103]CBZ24209.1 putative leucine-rich repeat protein [Leishmania mexicana MHOM/GT/2001/U1103]